MYNVNHYIITSTNINNHEYPVYSYNYYMPMHSGVASNLKNVVWKFDFSESKSKR